LPTTITVEIIVRSTWTSRHLSKLHHPSPLPTAGHSSWVHSGLSNQ
jgi:hypothetical protein